MTPRELRRTPRHRGAERVVLLLAVLAAAIAAANLLPVRQWLKDAGHLHQAVQSLGIWIYPVGVLAVASLVACGIPRLLLCTMGGMALGFWPGLAVAEAGTVIGYYCVFSFVRWGGRDWALHRWPKLGKWADVVKDHGILGVIFLRQVPIHGTVTNLGLGISRIKHRDFIIGTAIGVIPESIPFVLFGAGVMKGSVNEVGRNVVLAVIVFLVIWAILGYVMRSLRKSKAASEFLAEEAA